MEKRKGFTLVEVIISMLIFSLVLVLFTTIMMSGLTIHKQAIDITAKSMSGATIIEQKGNKVGSGTIQITFDKNGTKTVLKADGDKYQHSDGGRFLYFEATSISKIEE